MGTETKAHEKKIRMGENIGKTNTRVNKNRKGKKVMLWVLGTVAVLLVGVVIWFKLPYSPMKSDFRQITAGLISTMKADPAEQVFTEEEISRLPAPVQKYFRYCGYIGKPKMTNLRAYYNDVDFVLSPDKPKLKIKYTQYNFVKEPVRAAYIGTSMSGIPFEGLDAYQAGEGSMKGVLAKAVTLFDEKGPAMNKSGLVTCLAESVLIPSLLLQDYISWEEIDDTHAKATIEYFGESASGIFAFNEKGEILSFTTDDRENMDTSGNIRKARWSAYCSDYEEVNGIKHPTVLKAVWHFDSGDLVYFDGREITYEYNVGE
jgi:hypothetical protein